MKIKIFLSYSTKDKKLAGKIKYGLEQYGQDVFLAHEDIEPSTKWKQRILTELEACQVFVPLLTDNFRQSKWTDQESGIAMEKDKVIIPIKTGYDPHGFLSQYQALILRPDIESTGFEIMKIISGYHKFGINLKNLIIKKYKKSKSFIETSRNFDFLFTFSKFTAREVENILTYAMLNDQIYKYISAKNRLEYFIKKSKKKINPKILRRFRKFFKAK
jgi:hypothetical protein